MKTGSLIYMQPDMHFFFILTLSCMKNSFYDIINYELIMMHLSKLENPLIVTDVGCSLRTCSVCKLYVSL